MYNSDRSPSSVVVASEATEVCSEDGKSSLQTSEKSDYHSGTDTPTDRWVEVLVDGPPGRSPNLYTYHIPPDLSIVSGDILQVPFGPQQLGAIAIRLLDSPPSELAPEKIRDVRDVVSPGFFPPTYWQLLNRVASYYHTELMRVIRIALPPGLLRRSQRRIRLTPSYPGGKAIADDTLLTPVARQLLEVLESSKTKDLSWKALQGKVKGANGSLKSLLQRGWVESYLKPPKPPRPKLQEAVTLTSDPFTPELTKREQEVLGVLRQQGGELWLPELLQISKTSSTIVKALEKKGCIAIEEREVLRRDLGVPQKRDRPKVLTEAQTKALDIITKQTRYSLLLLHGVTGSGKTEVYLQAIAPILDSGRSALVLVPEIGLTPQLTDRFRARFGSGKIFVYHSALSDGERYDTWRQMLTGVPQIAIGTRSAVFAPLPKLGLIILDEEHDSSFKEDQRSPTYHARTVAAWRAELENCPLLLGSATPSLLTWASVTRSAEFLSFPGLESPEEPTPKYYLSLPERIAQRPMPPVEIVDMRREFQAGNRSIFSRSLQKELQRLIHEQKQGILFIHRRGHSTFVACRSCGYVMECPHCDVSLSYHYTQSGATQLLRCHYCNYTEVQPQQCPECNSPYLKHFGSGTQKVAQELAKHYPSLRCIRFDSDTTRTKDAHRKLLAQFANGKADILLGTQMITKGLDIAAVTLVGVVSADGLLNFADYRANERAFQILAQVAGRAGRGDDDPGKVIIQTYSPEHPVIQTVQHHDYWSFVDRELAERAEFNYPPYGRLILLRLSGLDLGEVEATAQKLAEVLTPENDDYQLLGPAPATILRVADRYRWQILLKFSPVNPVKLPGLMELRSHCPSSVSIMVDVDPIQW